MCSTLKNCLGYTSFVYAHMYILLWWLDSWLVGNELGHWTAAFAIPDSSVGDQLHVAGLERKEEERGRRGREGGMGLFNFLSLYSKSHEVSELAGWLCIRWLDN